MTPEELAAIRERAREPLEESVSFAGVAPSAEQDRRALLAHIDAITEAVEGLPSPDPSFPSGYYTSDMVSRAAVLVLLRGTPQREPVCSSPGCGLPERLHGAPPGEPPNPTRSTHHFRGTPQR